MKMCYKVTMTMDKETVSLLKFYETHGDDELRRQMKLFKRTMQLDDKKNISLCQFKCF